MSEEDKVEKLKDELDDIVHEIKKDSKTIWENFKQISRKHRWCFLGSVLLIGFVLVVGS